MNVAINFWFRNKKPAEHLFVITDCYGSHLNNDLMNKLTKYKESNYFFVIFGCNAQKAKNWASRTQIGEIKYKSFENSAQMLEFFRNISASLVGTYSFKHYESDTQIQFETQMEYEYGDEKN
mmetsp:Transcript_33021/g.29922  ORF Transcript_33021/g.29922 Transcript_33021/m.29922 type:complete len:122 (+) Transcript_33021:345-710(+)